MFGGVSVRVSMFWPVLVMFQSCFSVVSLLCGFEKLRIPGVLWYY
jgi:hypothetical protein